MIYFFVGWVTKTVHPPASAQTPVKIQKPLWAASQRLQDHLGLCDWVLVDAAQKCLGITIGKIKKIYII